MASSDAWNAGWNLGAGYAQEKFARKEARADEEFERQANELLDQRKNLLAQYDATRDPNTHQPTDKSAPIQAQLDSVNMAIRQHYHPDKNPGALGKFGHLLTNALKITKPEQAPSATAQPAPVPPQPNNVSLAATPSYRDSSGKTQPGAPAANFSIPSQPARPEGATDTLAYGNPSGLIKPGNIPIWDRPTVQNADGSHSSEYSVSFANDEGQEVLVPTVVDGKFLTPDGKKPEPGSLQEKAMFHAAWQHYLKTRENLGTFDSPASADAYAEKLHNRGNVIPAGPKTKVTGPFKSSGQQKQFKKSEALAQKDTAGQIAGSPLSERQKAVQTQQAQDAANQVWVDSQTALFHKRVPNPTVEQEEQFNDLLTQHLLGMKASQLTGEWVQTPGRLNDEAHTPVTLLFNKKTGEYKTQGGDEVPSTIFSQWSADPKPTAGGPIRAWKQNADGKIVSVLLDRNTNQEIPGSEDGNILPPPYLTTRISVGAYHWVDENNQVHETPETRRTSPALPGPQKGATAPSAGTTPKGGVSKGYQPSKQTIKDRILGYKSSAPLNHAQQALSDAVKSAFLADRLLQEAQTNPNGMSEADRNFVLSLIRGEAGRVNQQEIQMMFQAGGWSQILPRYIAGTGYGQLPDELRNELVQFAHDQKDAAQEAVDSLKHGPTDTPAGTTGQGGAQPSSALPPGWNPVQ